MEKIFQTATGAILYVNSEKKFVGTNPATILMALLNDARNGEVLAMKLLSIIHKYGGIIYASESKKIKESEDRFPFLAFDEENILRGISSPEDFDIKARESLRAPITLMV